MKTNNLEEVKVYFLNLIQTLYPFPTYKYSQSLKDDLWVYDNQGISIEVHIVDTECSIATFISGEYPTLNKQNTIRIFYEKEAAGEYIKYLIQISKAYVLQYFHVFEYLMKQKNNNLYDRYTTFLTNNENLDNNIAVYCSIEGDITKDYYVEFCFNCRVGSALEIYYTKTKKSDVEWGVPFETPDKIFRTVHDLVDFLYQESAPS